MENAGLPGYKKKTKAPNGEYVHWLQRSPPSIEPDNDPMMSSSGGATCGGLFWETGVESISGNKKRAGGNSGPLKHRGSFNGMLCGIQFDAQLGGITGDTDDGL